MKRKLIALTMAVSLIAAPVAAGYTAGICDGVYEVSAAAKKITKKKAKSIAMKHAGVSKSDTVFISCEKDYDDGVLVYEVKINMNDGGEYEYTIHAKTGKILDYDFDMDD